MVHKLCDTNYAAKLNFVNCYRHWVNAEEIHPTLVCLIAKLPCFGRHVNSQSNRYVMLIHDVPLLYVEVRAACCPVQLELLDPIFVWSPKPTTISFTISDYISRVMSNYERTCALYETRHCNSWRCKQLCTVFRVFRDSVIKQGIVPSSPARFEPVRYLRVGYINELSIC